MRMSNVFGRTLREAPADAEGTGYQALLRAAFVRAAGAGRYTYLPFGQRSLARFERLIRDAIQPYASQELRLPLVVQGLTLSDAARDVAATDIQSYRQLPAHLFGAGLLQPREWLGRGGPLNAREAPAVFCCTLDASEEAAGAAYAAQLKTYSGLLARCGLPVILARDGQASSSGHAYLFLTPDGGQEALLCDGCGYTALADVAAFTRPPVEPEPALVLEKIPTPHSATIADLAQFLGVPESRTAKAILLMATTGDGERFVFAVVRGDMDLSERKLSLALGARQLRPASEAEIRAAGATPGYASPVDLKNVLVIVDELVPQSPNLVSGANDEGYHLLNTNYGRDYTAQVSDIAAARPGDSCPECSAPMRSAAVAVLGSSRQLARGQGKGAPVYLDAAGRMQPVSITIHELDLGAVLAATAEQHHDDHGLLLPPTIAPYLVHLVGMPGAEAEAELLYTSLWDAGIDCLYDDRGESAGVKFTDADLLGLPLRITLGKRSLQAGGAEFKPRIHTEKVIVPLEGAVEAVREALAIAETEIAERIEEEPYGEHLR